MPVTLAFRSVHCAPDGYFVRHDQQCDSILGWFQQNWLGIEEINESTLNSITAHLGHPALAHEFARMFLQIHTEQILPPKSLSELVRLLTRLLRTPRIRRGKHTLQLLDIDTSSELLMFDGTYAERYPHHCAFLNPAPRLWPDSGENGMLRIRWLGADRISLRGGGSSTLLIFNPTFLWNGRDVRHMFPHQISGVRVHDFPRYLLALGQQMAVFPHEAHYHEALTTLATGVMNFALSRSGDERAFLNMIANNPNNLLPWSAYSDWLEDRGLPPAGRYLLEQSLRHLAPSESPGDEFQPDWELTSIRNHVAQLTFRRVNAQLRGQLPAIEARIENRLNSDEYAQIMLFDDHWAFEHSNLAHSATRCASRWDPL